VYALRQAAVERLQLDFCSINYLAITDADPGVRRAGIESSLEDCSPRLFDLLVTALLQDGSARARLAAAEDLGRFVLLAELEDLDRATAERVRQVLLDVVHDAGQAPGVRAAARGSLGYFSDQGISDEMASAFQDPDLRLGAVRGMGRSADPQWTDRLLPVLGSEDPDMRLEAARALGEIEDERAVGALSNVVDDPVLEVRLAAIEALGAIGGEDARETLLYLAESTEERIHEAADRALHALEFYEDPMGL
jgi:HEAT repeat protein